MTADKPSPFVPKLRFPEFIDHGPWDAKLLDDLCDRLSETVGDTQLTPVSISAGKGFVPQAEKFGRDISGSQYSKYIWLQRGDFAYNRGNSKRFPQGCVYQLTEFDEAAASNAFHCFRLHDHCEPMFVSGFFENNGHGRQLIRHITSGARSNGLLNISAGTFFGITVPIPPTEAEQQKISDCLGSLDDLIAAESRKLEALRQHKQGLMQQLFPQLGETVPRLRFPEFREAGEWEERLVGDVFKVTRGKVLAMPLVRDSRSNETPFPVYSSQTKNRGLAGYYSEYLYEDAITWTTDGANAGDVNYRTGKFYCTNVCGVLINNDGQANLCTAELINSVSRQHVSFVGNPKLMNGVMSKIAVPFPKPAEQQRIAPSLSSLEDVLAAQARKIDALKQKKQGLLQQLFPSLETE